MGEAPAYVILGRGRWAQRMQPIIAGESRKVSLIQETRRGPTESDSAYLSRLAGAMKSSGAQIAWLCVTPGPHVSLMIRAALEAGLHARSRKTLVRFPRSYTPPTIPCARKRRVLAVHFEYLVLESVENWKRTLHPGMGLHFAGRFFLSRSDLSGTPAIDNLGCHLASICEYAVPEAEFSELQCAYERPDERLVWLEKDGQTISSINLFQGSQEIIQGFIRKVEAASTSAAFPFDLGFALRVANRLNAYKARSST